MLFGKPSSKLEVVNDIHSDLVNLFRIAKYHPDALMRELDLVLYSREEFLHLRKTDQAHKTDIQRAAWFFQGLDQSFGSQGYKAGFGYSRTQGPVSRTNNLHKIQTLCERLDKVIVENLDYKDCISRYDASSTFFFIDPPYIGGSQKTYSSWTHKELQELRELLAGIKGSWLVTMSSDETVRELFKGCKITDMVRPLGVDNRKGGGRTYHEVIITPRGQKGGIWS